MRFISLRRLIYIAVALVVLAVCALGGVGWYFSSQLLSVTHEQDQYSLQVLALRGHAISLTRGDNVSRPGTFGLEWAGGRALLGAIVSSDGNSVLRRVSGSIHGLRVGTPVRIDVRVYTSPAALHLKYRTVSVPDPLGSMPAWYIPGTRHTWAIFVHGYKVDRREGLRAVPVVAGLGLPVLDISYRNDVGAPYSPDHLYHLGSTEWQDVQAGVSYALAHGAHDVILYGYSMGGATVEYFLHHSRYAGRVRAVVLDAPALDWSAVLDLQASHRGLPGFVTAVAKRIIAYRIGMSNLDSLDEVRSAASLRAPTLLFQGTADSTVPVAPSLAFARARPDLVTYVSVAGAEHTQGWNVNPASYRAKLRAFLVRVLR